jgi:hypothetical protein
MVVVQNSLDVAVADADVALLQGSAALKGTAGSGSVAAGYKKQMGPHDALEVNAVLGLRSLVTVTSTRQLGTYTSAALSASYSPGQGLGMQVCWWAGDRQHDAEEGGVGRRQLFAADLRPQWALLDQRCCCCLPAPTRIPQVTSSRQVTAATSASLTWVIGPAPGTAMVFTLTHRGTRYVITGRLDLGLVTSLSSRLTYQVSEAVSVKLSGRCGTSGIDGELGLARRLGPGHVLYGGSVVSWTGGTYFKLRYARAGQVFEFPVLLTTDVHEWQLLAAATLLPPLGSWLALRYVVRPLRAWSARRADAARRRERGEQLRSAATRAAAERALLAPVARRKARAEAAAGGLVILEAAYGVLHEYRLARAAAAAAGSGPSGVATATAAAGQQQQNQQHPQRPDTQPHLDARQQQQPQQPPAGKRAKHHHSEQEQQQQPAASSMNGSSAQAGGQQQQHGDEASSSSDSSELPPPWLDVTQALQYLVSAGKLELHGGVSKLGLMGFADVAPGAERELYVAYAYGQQLFEKTVGDAELLRLPGAGEPVVAEDVAARLWALHRRECASEVGAAR